MERVSAAVRGYAYEHEEADYRLLSERFGSPDQIVLSCLEELEEKDLLQCLTEKRKTIIVVILTACILVLMWAGLIISAYVDHRKNDNGYAVIGPVIIETEVIYKEAFE